MAPRCEICCWARAERTVAGTVNHLLFKFTYMVYVVTVPVFLVWMIVAPKPVDQTVFGPVRDPNLLSGNTTWYTDSVEVTPSLSSVSKESLHQSCGAPGMVSWNLTVNAVKNFKEAQVPILLASEAMTTGKYHHVNSPHLKWHAVAQPADFGNHALLSGMRYETPWLKGVGCHGQAKAPKLSNQDRLLVCVSDKMSVESVDDCNIIKADCSGGMAGWFFHNTCEGADVALLAKDNGGTMQKCQDKRLKPAGICKRPANATDCQDCEEWGCKTPAPKGECTTAYTEEDCTTENPDGNKGNSFPEFKIVFKNSEDHLTKKPYALANKPVQLFLSDGKGWSLFYSSAKDSPSALLDMSSFMSAKADPKWCFGPRTKSFYMVACLTPGSGTNEKKWSLDSPPVVDGPPFNDRCTALVGICGGVGTAARASGMTPEYCTEQGTIRMDRLVDKISYRRNGGSFWFYGFITFMVLAHMSTLITYFGGLFRTGYLTDEDALASRSTEMCTNFDELNQHFYAMQKVGALVIWGASMSEERLFILRNWVGRIASVPEFGNHVFGKTTRCLDVFMDEGHRLGAKILWSAFIDFLETRPPRLFLETWSKRLRDFSFEDAKEGNTARGKSGDPFWGLNYLWDEHMREQAAEAAGSSGVPAADQRHPLLLQSEESHGSQAAASSGMPAAGTNPYASFPPEGSQAGATASVELAEIGGVVRGTPQQSQGPRQETDSEKFGAELKNVEGCVDALCRLMEAFRDNQFKENLESRDTERKEDKTRDDVMHRSVTLNPRCTIDCLYVARAREKDMPLAAYTNLAVQHEACLHLPMRRDTDETWANRSAENRTVIEYREQLSGHVKNIAMRLYIAEHESWTVFEGSIEGSRRRQMSKQRLWLDLVKVQDGPLPEDPHALVQAEWFERVEGSSSGQKTPGMGFLRRSMLSEGNGFRPMVPRVEGELKLTPWEIGRLCTGKVISNKNGMVTLSGLSPFFLYLSHRPQIRELMGSQEELGHMFTVKEDYLAPLCGSRGKGGAQNFALQLLRNRGLLNPPEQHNMASFMPMDAQHGGAGAGSGPSAGVAPPSSWEATVISDVPRADLREPLLESHGSQAAASNGVPAAGTNPFASFTPDSGVPAAGITADVELTDLGDDVRGVPPHAQEVSPSGLRSMVTPLADTPRGSQEKKRVLFAIFDARHQPTPEYFREVLPKFFKRVTTERTAARRENDRGGDGYSNMYELDDLVGFAQVPQTFAKLEIVDDALDTNNGMMFNMLNLVRNNCGAVTSCGTNSTWQVEAPSQLADEFFDARTKIEDTATSHRVFLNERRSVYVNSPCVIGIAKRNARYLGAVARWSEGAVQLFWVTLLGDRNQMVFVVAYKLLYLGLIYLTLILCHFRPMDDYWPLCKKNDLHSGLCGMVMAYDRTGATIHVIQGAIIWGLVVVVNIVLFEFVRGLYGATPLVRRVVMLDNLTYFWSTGAAFFWVGLNFYMIFSGEIPFQYDIRTWMYWLLSIKVLQYILTYLMKSKGDCKEASIWRSQQMFFVTAPLHQLSIITGTMGAFAIIWRKIDKSWWTTDNSDQVLFLVKAWTTFIVGSAGAAIVFVILALAVNYNDVTSSIISATIILFFMALCVWDAFMDVWEFTGKLLKAAKLDKKGDPLAEDPNTPARCHQKALTGFARFLWHSREWTWIVRWIMDFGMPFAVLVLIERQSFGIAAAFSFILRL